MKLYLFSILLIMSACQSSSKSESKSIFSKQHTARREQCEKPFVFFDLGETIVDTATHNYKKIFYLPGAELYLKSLADQNFKLGMIVNVPETWGTNHKEKLTKLKAFIKGPWVPAGEDFNWNIFDENLILLPPKDTDRKPAAFMFQEALAKAKLFECQAVFQGEELEEIKVAKELGVHAFHIKRKINENGEMEPVFMTTDELINLGQFNAD